MSDTITLVLAGNKREFDYYFRQITRREQMFGFRAVEIKRVGTWYTLPGEVLDAAELIEREYASRRMPNKCTWTETWEGQWETECGEIFEFFWDGPKENRQRYCGYCGREINQVDYVEKKDETS